MICHNLPDSDSNSPSCSSRHLVLIILSKSGRIQKTSMTDIGLSIHSNAIQSKCIIYPDGFVSLNWEFSTFVVVGSCKHFYRDLVDSFFWSVHFSGFSFAVVNKFAFFDKTVFWFVNFHIKITKRSPPGQRSSRVRIFTWSRSKSQQIHLRWVRFVFLCNCQTR